MTDQKLDELLEEVFKEQVEVKPSLVYKARSRGREKIRKKETRKEQYPFLIILTLNVLITALIGLGSLLFIQERSLFMINLIFSISFIFMNIPVVVYLLARIYYKDQGNLKEE